MQLAVIGWQIRENLTRGDMGKVFSHRADYLASVEGGQQQVGSGKVSEGERVR